MRVARHLGDRVSRVREIASDFWTSANFADPLRHWNDLLFHSDWDERERLEGVAYAAHFIKDMALLLARLLKHAGAGETWDIVDPGTSAWMAKRLAESWTATASARRCLSRTASA